MKAKRLSEEHTFLTTKGRGRRQWLAQLAALGFAVAARPGVAASAASRNPPPRDAAPLVPALEAARAAGAYLIAISRLVPGFLFDALVTGDNYAIGARAAELLATLRPEGGPVAMLEGLPGTTPAMQRGTGFRATLRRYPQWRLIAAEPADYLRHKAARVVEAWAAAGVSYDALYAHSDSMLVGARAAWRRLGVDPRALITIGVDYIAAARTAILAGEQTASFRYPLMVDEAGAVAQAWLRHGKVIPFVDVATPLITAQNAADEAAIF